MKIESLKNVVVGDVEGNYFALINEVSYLPTHRDDSSDDFEVCGPLLSARTAREAAFIAIEEFRNSGTWLSDVLDRIFRSASLPPIERGLATELA